MNASERVLIIVCLMISLWLFFVDRWPYMTMAPKQYFIKWWAITSKILWQWPEGFFTRNVLDVYPLYEFENYEFNVTTARSGWYVNMVLVNHSGQFVYLWRADIFLCFFINIANNKMSFQECALISSMISGVSKRRFNRYQSQVTVNIFSLCKVTQIRPSMPSLKNANGTTTSH